MLSLTQLLSHVKINSFNPWKLRPSGLLRNNTPQMVHPGYYKSAYRKKNLGDQTLLLKPRHVIIKRCPACKRTKLLPLSEKSYFHTCCEGVEMRYLTDMSTVMQKEQELVRINRQWDIENERPWCNPHKPRPKGRSKFKK